MNKIRLPKRINIFGQTIEIELSDTIQDTEDAEGLSLYRKNKIILNNYNRTDEQIENNFFHEIMHFVFCYLNENDLKDNEKLVHLIGAVLHQIFKTAEY